jgi:acyl carrier protein
MRNKLIKILQDLHPGHDFFESQDFIGEGLLDSFDIVTLVVELEQHFRIEIDGSDVTPENFKNLETLKNFVEKSILHNLPGGIYEF